MTEQKDNGGAPKGAPRLFSPAVAARLRAQRVGKPTGTIVNLGGYDIDLHPFNTAEGEEVFALIGRTSEFQKALADKNGAGVTSVMLTELISKEGTTIVKIARGLLGRSLGVKSSDAAAFEEWFGEQPLIDMLKTLVPAIMEANGFAQMVRPKTAPAEQTEADGASESSTPTMLSV